MAGINVNVQNQNNINLEVVPTPTQIVQINRGVAGRDGGDFIGGYPVVMSSIQPRDVVMFGSGEWNNVNQTEISDGGNF
jgi:hypothetical protein